MNAPKELKLYSLKMLYDSSNDKLTRRSDKEIIYSN